MLSMLDINQLLKDNFQKQLQGKEDLIESVAKGYKAWVQGLMSLASQKMSQEASPAQGQPQPQA